MEEPKESEHWKTYIELYDGLSRSELNHANPTLYKKLRESGELARIPYSARRIEEIAEPILTKYENEISPKSGKRYCDLTCEEFEEEDPEFLKKLMTYVYKDKPPLEERAKIKRGRNKKKITRIVLLDDMFDTEEDEKGKALKERIKQKINSEYSE